MDSAAKRAWQPLSRAVRQRAVRLHSLKGRRKTGLFLIEGFRLLGAALEHGWPIETIIARDDDPTRERLAVLLKSAKQTGPALYAAPAEAVQELAATVHPAGVIALARPKEILPPADGPAGARLLLVDNMRDPGNLGAVVRSAAAFGVEAVYLSPGTVDMFNPKAVRASMGGLFVVPVYQNVDLRALGEQMRADGYVLLVADPRDGQPPGQCREHKKWALIIGGETEGYAGFWRTLQACPVRIPMSPHVESLNSAVAAGIILCCLSGGSE